MQSTNQFLTILALLLFAISGGYAMGRTHGFRDGYYEGLCNSHAGDWFTTHRTLLKTDVDTGPRHMRQSGRDTTGDSSSAQCGATD